MSNRIWVTLISQAYDDVVLPYQVVLSLAGAWATHIASLQQRARPSPGELQALGLALIGAADACAKAVADRSAATAAAAGAAAAAGTPEGELLGSALTGAKRNTQKNNTNLMGATMLSFGARECSMGGLSGSGTAYMHQ